MKNLVWKTRVTSVKSLSVACGLFNFLPTELSSQNLESNIMFRVVLFVLMHYGGVVNLSRSSLGGERGGSRSAVSGCGRGTALQQFRWMSASDTEKGLVRSSPGRHRLHSLSATGFHTLPRTKDSLTIHNTSEVGFRFETSWCQATLPGLDRRGGRAWLLLATSANAS